MQSGELGGAAPPEPSIALEILDSLQAIVLVVDESGSLVFQNRAAEEARQSPGADEKTAPLLRQLSTAAAEVRVGGQERTCTFEIDEVAWRCRLWNLPRGNVAAAVRPAAAARSATEAVATALGISMGDARLAVRIARGLSNQVIASSLGIAIGTITSRLWRLYRRVGVANRAELAARVSQIVVRVGPDPELLDPDGDS